MVNDRVDIALLSGASGVHLGQTDLPPVAARRILGSARIIGYSTHNLNQALVADGLPVDYIAVGPIFATATKENPDHVVGLDKLAEICRSVKKPVVAIGGITLQDAQQVINAGAYSVAIVRDLLARRSISEGVRTFERALKSATT